MDPQNTSTDAGAKVMFDHAKTLRLHTGNLVNRGSMKKKCPSSPSEEVRGRPLATSVYIDCAGGVGGSSTLA